MMMGAQAVYLPVLLELLPGVDFVITTVKNGSWLAAVFLS
jgi:hypothetical protein